MEHAFGHDFSGVKARTGVAAGLPELGALAAAEGETIAFAETSPSRETVAHELTHVVQARGGQGGVHEKSAVSDPGDPAEREAEQVAPRAAAGERVEVAAAAGADIHRNAPPAVDLSSVFVSFTLPGHRVLNTKDSIQTRDPTTITITVTPGSLSVRAAPAIYIDATYPANNMLLYGATYNFASGGVAVDVSIDQEGWGFLDYRNVVRDSVTDTITKGLAGTPAAARGYNPMADPNPLVTLQAVKTQFISLPSSPGAVPLMPNELGRAAAGGTFASRTVIDQGSGDGSVHIDAGGSVSISIQGDGSAGDIMAGATLQAQADAARIRSIQISSQAIQILKGGAPVARLDECTIERGGTVRIQRLKLLGSAQTASSVESLLRLLVGMAAAHGQGAPDQLAFAIGASNSEATIVPGFTAAELERRLSDAVRQLVRDNATAIPGIDLMQVFGVAGASTPSPPRH
jgi:hypothetical protein